VDEHDERIVNILIGRNKVSKITGEAKRGIPIIRLMHLLMLQSLQAGD